MMHPLPPYARRVEYLESTGSQWIDTGSTIRSTWSISVTCSVTTTPDNQAIWSARKVTGPGQPRNDWRTDSLFVINSTNPTSGRFDYGIEQVGKSFNFNGWAGVHEYKTVGGKLFIDGTKYAEHSDLDFETGGPLRIFAGESVNEPGTFNVFCVGKIYAVKVLDASGATVRSFVPCRILDVGYLWDEVEGKFYGNSGTGDFVLGPDVREGVVPTRLNPFGVGRRMEKIRRVEYLESTGTQYVDTGYHPSSAIGYDVKFRIANAAWIFRAGNSFNVNIIGMYGGTTGVDIFAHFPRINSKFRSLIGVDVDAILSNHVLTVNGNSTTISFSYPYDNEMKLFTDGSSRLYHARFYESDTLVRSFVPVRIGTVGYLFDRVSGQLFGNAGTGDFVLGPDTSRPAG